MYIICLIILTFFAVIGLATFISAIRNAALACDGEIIVILPDIDEHSAEARVRYASSVVESAGECRIVAVCTDEGSKQICDRLKTQFEYLEVAEPSELQTFLHMKESSP